MILPTTAQMTTITQQLRRLWRLFLTALAIGTAILAAVAETTWD